MFIDRGTTNGRNPRLGSVDVESHQDFVRGFRGWTFTEMDKVSSARANEILKDLRLNDAANAPLESFRDAFEADPVIGTRLRCWISSQQLMWRSLLDHYRQHSDHYLAELEAADKSGPGTLELNPDMKIPDYAAHEIHIQPGGYVGDEFAGPLYHYGTNSFYGGANDADQFHIGLAKALTRPADGKVNRIVDLGCGVGQLTVALAEAYPEADVWGLDVGGPLVRYAHKRAVDLGVAVNFAQRLAEDTKFADGSVDLATAYIMFHEVPLEVTRQICAEVFRILRPGGVFDVTDFHTARTDADPAYRRFFSWADHKYNSETWSQEFVYSDFLQVLAEAGFEVEKGEPRHWGIAGYIGRKPA
jgi:ubiquinone/menaquinone biosynthesis C-methylase UbiE